MKFQTNKVTNAVIKNPEINRKGFTLIELMISIAIIVVLTAIIIVNITSTRSKGRDAKKVADVGSIVISLEAYYSKNRYYPLTLTDLDPYLGKTSATSFTDIKYFPLYLKRVTTSNVTCGDATGNVKPNYYHISTELENKVTVDKAGKSPENPSGSAGPYGFNEDKIITCSGNGTNFEDDSLNGTPMDGTEENIYDAVPSF